MITIIQPIAAGNALRVFVEPPAGASKWRVLRKGSDSFSGPEDDTALLAFEGDDKVFVDCASLINEVMAFYKPYYWVNNAWTPGQTASGTPSPTYHEMTTDALSLVRERLEHGLKVEVERGNLQSELGYVQVYTAPPSLEQNIRFPCVTITGSDNPIERGIGDDIYGDDYLDSDDEWMDSEGWISQVQLEIVGWSLNSDERIELQKALKRLIIANLPVFTSKGLDLVQASFQQVDAVSGEFGAPMYQTLCSFSCIAPTRVGSTVGKSIDIEVNISNG